MKVVNVPHYDALKREHALKFIKDYPESYKFLPDGKELDKVHRQWMYSVLSTVIGTPFTKWVERGVQARNEEIARERNMLIQMDPAIARAF